MVIVTIFGAVAGAAIGAIWALLLGWLDVGDLSVGSSALNLAVAGGIIAPLYDLMRRTPDGKSSGKKRANVSTWSVMHPWTTALACALATAALVLVTTALGTDQQQSWLLVLVTSSVVFVTVGTYNRLRYGREGRERRADRR